MNYYEKATNLIEDIWRNIDWDSMKEGRRRNAMSEFEAKTRALSKCYSSLKPFLDKLCRSFDSRLSSDSVKQILTEGQDGEYLTIFRTETQMPFLLLKLRQNERKNKAKQECA